MPTAFLVGGFLLAIVGIGLYSIRAALIVAGTVLFIAGGLEGRAAHQRRNTSR